MLGLYPLASAPLGALPSGSSSPADTTAPVMSGALASSTITSSGFTLTWPAASDDTGVAGYETSLDGGATWADQGLVLTKTFSALAASTVYPCAVRAYDAAGNRATPLSMSVTTAAAADATAPTMTGAVTASAIGQNGFTISWPAGSDNVAVTGYEYSIDGGTGWTDAGNVLTKAITSLLAGTLYPVRVRDYDAAGNRSTPLALDVTTAAATPAPNPRYARPQSDVSAGPWSASTDTSLAAMIDEPSADSADYIVASAPGLCEIALNPVTDPGTSSGQVVRYQIWSDAGDGITVRLMQGATIIAAWPHSPAPSTPTIYAQALTAAECDSITNYADLRFQFEAL